MRVSSCLIAAVVLVTALNVTAGPEPGGVMEGGLYIDPYGTYAMTNFAGWAYTYDGYTTYTAYSKTSASVSDYRTSATKGWVLGGSNFIIDADTVGQVNTGAPHSDSVNVNSTWSDNWNRSVSADYNFSDSIDRIYARVVNSYYRLVGGYPTLLHTLIKAKDTTW